MMLVSILILFNFYPQQHIFLLIVLFINILTRIVISKSMNYDEFNLYLKPYNMNDINGGAKVLFPKPVTD